MDRTINKMSESNINENEVTVEEIEDPPIITAKDPKKVEQGKRLAAISKEAKEKKMRARIKEEDFSYLPWIGYGVAITSSFLLMMILFKKEEDHEILKMKTIYKESEAPPSPVKRKKFETF